MKIVVVDELFAATFRKLPSDWPAPGMEVVIPDSLELEDLGPVLADADAIVTVMRVVDRAMIDLAPKLKTIARPGAGFDNVDVATATERGIAVTNVTGTRSQSVAEHAWFMILHLARRGWLRSDPAAWTTEIGVQLQGRTLGVVGFGGIGRSVARIGAGFGMTILCHTRTPDPALEPDLSVEFLDLESCLERADVLVLSVPLTEQTRHWIDAERLALMPQGSFLINVARGAVVVTEDLADAVANGHLGGAGLDVTDPEPLDADHRLHGFANVVVSPHVAGRNDRAQRDSIEVLRQNLLGVLTEASPNLDRVVNPEFLAHRPA